MIENDQFGFPSWTPFVHASLFLACSTGFHWRATNLHSASTFTHIWEFGGTVCVSTAFMTGEIHLILTKSRRPGERYGDGDNLCKLLTRGGRMIGIIYLFSSYIFLSWHSWPGRRSHRISYKAWRVLLRSYRKRNLLLSPTTRTQVIWRFPKPSKTYYLHHEFLAVWQGVPGHWDLLQTFQILQ